MSPASHYPPMGAGVEVYPLTQTLINWKYALDQIRTSVLHVPLKKNCKNIHKIQSIKLRSALIRSFACFLWSLSVEWWTCLKLPWQRLTSMPWLVKACCNLPRVVNAGQCVFTPVTSAGNYASDSSDFTAEQRRASVATVVAVINGETKTESMG